MVVVKRIDDLIGKSNKSVNIVYVLPNAGSQHLGSHGEGGAIYFCHLPTANLRNVIKKGIKCAYALNCLLSIFANRKGTEILNNFMVAVDKLNVIRIVRYPPMFSSNFL